MLFFWKVNFHLNFYSKSKCLIFSLEKKVKNWYYIKRINIDICGIISKKGEKRVRMNKREVGFKYENVAKEYLILQGLVFVESNFYTKFGEIDLIFFEKSSQTLVFVEVKYRKSDFFGSAIEMVTEEKQNRILASSQVYLLKKNWDRNVRYDVVGVSKDSGNIEWLKNAF